MRGNRKIRQNSFRSGASESAGINFDFMESLELCLKFIMIIILISLVSLLFIFIHDGLIQSKNFSLNKISVSGYSRLTRSAILKQAGVVPGENIFSINLFKVKKRLIAHEWIADASVERKIPAGLAINIKEETPLAVVKLGKHAGIIINDHGMPFTVFDPHARGKKTALSLVNGLNLEKKDGVYGFSGRSFHSVMKFLSGSYLSVIHGGFSVNSPRNISQITADKDMGLSIRIANPAGVAGSGLRMEKGAQMLMGQGKFVAAMDVKMGFDQYEARCRRMKRIIDYLKTKGIHKRICSMDLSDLENVAVKFEEIHNRDDFPGSIKGGV